MDTFRSGTVNYIHSLKSKGYIIVLRRNSFGLGQYWAQLPQNNVICLLIMPDVNYLMPSTNRKTQGSVLGFAGGFIFVDEHLKT